MVNKMTFKKKAMFLGFTRLFVLLVLAVQPALAQDYERPSTLRASRILDKGLLKGANYAIEEQVVNDGLMNHYLVKSKFGEFRADSSASLLILLHEINGIAAMRKVKTDDTALAGMQQAGENTITGIQNLLTDPEGTLEGAASGIGSLFNRATETVGRREVGESEDNQFKQLIGVSKSKGIIATKYEVNVYSRNQVVQEELDRLAMADYLGGIGVGLATSVVPGVGGLVLTTSGTARLLNEAINTTPGSELWLRNKNVLLALGMNEDTVELFLNNPVFSPAKATLLTEALKELKGVSNLELFLKVALQASTDDMAQMITETAVLTAGYHKNVEKLSSIAPMARLTKGIKANGTAVLTLPTDHIIWSERVARVASAIKTNGGVELWTPGDLSQRTEAELKALGWQLHPRAASTLLAERKK